MPGLDETDAQFRYRLRDPGDFEEGSSRTMQLKGTDPPVVAIVGKLKGETSTTLQAYRFNKEDGWTKDKAQAWIDGHKESNAEDYDLVDPSDLFTESSLPSTILGVRLSSENRSILRDLYDYAVDQGVEDPVSHAVEHFKEKYEEAVLETVSLPDVPILTVGKHTGSSGVTRDYTPEVLRTIVRNHDRLRKLGGFRALLKLGFFKIDHDEEQELRRSLRTIDKAPDGMPAIGWPDRLKVRGNTLLGDFVKVPKRIAALLKAGAFPGRSPEVKWNARHPETGEQIGPALWAVSLLGAKQPAIKTLADIESLYHKEKEVDAECEILYFAESEESESGETVLVPLVVEPTKSKESKMAEKVVSTELYEEAVRNAAAAKTESDRTILDLQNKLTDAEGQVGDLTTERDGVVDRLSEADRRTRAAELDAFLEENKVPPAVRPIVRRGMLHADADAVIKYSEGDDEKTTTMLDLWKSVGKAFAKPELFQERGSSETTPPADDEDGRKVDKDVETKVDGALGVTKEDKEKYGERTGFGDTE